MIQQIRWNISTLSWSESLTRNLLHVMKDLLEAYNKPSGGKSLVRKRLEYLDRRGIIGFNQYDFYDFYKWKSSNIKKSWDSVTERKGQIADRYEENHPLRFFHESVIPKFLY